MVKIQAVELVQELGLRLTAVTKDTREATCLFQRLSVALQRGNAVSFHSTFTTRRNAAVRRNLLSLQYFTLGNWI